MEMVVLMVVVVEVAVVEVVVVVVVVVPLLLAVQFVAWIRFQRFRNILQVLVRFILTLIYSLIYGALFIDRKEHAWKDRKLKFTYSY